MSELATTYVRIRPRSTGFKSEADAQLRREKPSDQTVQVSADTRPAEQRLSLLNDRLDSLRLRTTEARVRLSGDDRALGRLAEIDAAMIRLDRARANPKIDLEGVAKAEAQLAALNAQLDRLDRRGAGGGGGFGRLAGFGRGGFFGGLGLLGVAGGSAAVPLSVGALGLGASFATPAVAGTAGLGLFGAASASAFSRVGKTQGQLEQINKRIAQTPQTTTTTTQAASAAQIAAAQARLEAARQRLAAAQVSPTASASSLTSARAGVISAESSLSGLQGRGGTSTKANAEYAKLIKQRNALLKQLTPAERDAAKNLDALEDAWKRFQRALEPESFKLLATGADIFRHGLHDLLPMTKAVGDEVDTLAVRAEKALDAPFWQHFFHDFLTREAPLALDSLFTSTGHVVTGIAHLAEQWTPLGHDLEHGLVSITDRFDRWSQGQGPLRFMALVERDGPIAAQALSSLASALVGIAKGLEPIGRIELQALTPILRFVGELGEQHPEVITALGVAYLTVAGGLKAIAAVDKVNRVLDGATGGLGRLRTGALLTAGAIGVYEVGKHSSSQLQATLGGALTGLTVGLLTFGPEGAVIGAFAGGMVSLGLYLATARGEVASFTAQVDGLAASLANAVQLDKGLLGSNVKQQVKQLLLTNPEFQKPGKYGHTLLETLAKYNVTIDDLIAHAQGQDPASYKKLINAAEKSGNMTLINQFSDLILSIEQALRNARDISLVSGGTGSGGGGGHKKHGGGGHGGGGSAAPISVVPIDLTGAGVDAGGTYVTGVATGIDKAAIVADRAAARLAGRIRDRMTAIAQFQQQITSSLLGETGLGAFTPQTDAVGNQVAPSTKGIIAGLTHQRDALKLLRDRLHSERGHGLSIGAEKQILGLGLSRGGAFAGSLSTASRAELRSISRLLTGVHGDAAAVGRDVTRDIYGPRIAGLLEDVRDLLSGKKGQHLDTPVVRELHRLNDQLEGFSRELRGAHHKSVSRTS